MIHCFGFFILMLLTQGCNTSVLPRTVRLQFLQNAKNVLITTSTIIAAASGVNAKVAIDTATYGDRELTIATINKCKQKLRNAILSDADIAVQFLKISLNDALGYDSSNGDGGPDGSIALPTEAKRKENEGLEKGLNALTQIKNQLQRTNSLSYADIIAFAGAEALESFGAERIAVQIGRSDSREENVKKGINWTDESSNGEDILTAFKSSGIAAKDVALLLGALGEITRLLAESKSSSTSSKGSENDDDDDVLDGDEKFENAIPSTFGRSDEKFGSKVSNSFSSKYFKQVLEKKGGVEPYSKLLYSDSVLKGNVQKYADNSKAFIEDLKAAYLRLGLLGEEYSTRNS